MQAIARNCACLAILWKIKFEFSGSANSCPCTQREIARQPCSPKYLTLYRKSIACPAYTALIQVGAKVEVDREGQTQHEGGVCCTNTITIQHKEEQYLSIQ